MLALSGISVSFARECFIGLDRGDDRLNGNPSVGDQLTTRAPRGRCERRRPEVLPDEDAGGASRIHGGGEVLDVLDSGAITQVEFDALEQKALA